MIAFDGTEQRGRMDGNTSLFGHLTVQAIEQALTRSHVTSGNGRATSGHVNQNKLIAGKAETMYGRYGFRVPHRLRDPPETDGTYRPMDKCADHSSRIEARGSRARLFHSHRPPVTLAGSL